MRVSCKYCGRTHQQGEVCTRKPKRTKYVHDKKIDAFRHSRGWGDARQEVLDRDYHICRICEMESNEYGFVGRRYNSRNLSVHHIVPLAEDWSRRMDHSNLITVCSIHHEMCERGEIDREIQFELAACRPQFK